MNTNYFLKQSVGKTIFLIFIIPVIIQLILVNIVQSVSDVRLYYITFVFFWVLYLPYFYWLNIAVNFLYSRTNHFKLKLNNFKISLILIIIMALNFVVFIAYMFSFVFNGGEPKDIIFIYVGLIQVVGTISFIYNSYFVSKLIGTIELKRNVHFSDVVGNLVAFSFPPLAIWIIQNKVKKIQMILLEECNKEEITIN